MRLSPWLEKAVAYLLINHPDVQTYFDIDVYNEGKLYLDLCEAGADEIWEVGSFRGDSFISAEATFFFETPADTQTRSHLYLSSVLQFHPTTDLLPQSWRVRWVEAEPAEPPEDWVAEERVLIAGPLAESGELRANVTYNFQPSDFHLWFENMSLYVSRMSFERWFFEIFFTRIYTSSVYDEKTWMFFKDTEWPPGGNFPDPTGMFPPVPPFCVELKAADWEFDLQGGTLRNSAPIHFTEAWDGKACNMLCIYRQRGNGDPVTDWLYFFIVGISDGFKWERGVIPTFLPGELVINVA